MRKNSLCNGRTNRLHQLIYNRFLKPCGVVLILSNSFCVNFFVQNKIEPLCGSTYSLLKNLKLAARHPKSRDGLSLNNHIRRLTIKSKC